MSNIQILVVDDEPDILHLLKISLERMALTVFTAATIAEAKKELHKTTFNFCLTDMKLTDGNGLELVEYVTKKYPSTPIAVITAYGTINHAVEALKKGAFDFITKPISINVLRNLVANAITDSGSPEQQLEPTELIGKSKYSENINKLIKKLAKSQSPINISGPAHTHKKVIAECVHNLSSRNSKEFYSFNCIKQQQNIMELFATKDNDGLLAKASGSTLLIENIGSLPIDMQDKLYEIITNKKLTANDGSVVDLDIRLISTCRNDLTDKISQGLFQKDLYDRLSVMKIATQALNSHREDIPRLSKNILKKYAKKQQKLPCKIDSQALHVLSNYNYSDNMLELQELLEESANLCDNHIIREADLNLNDNNSNRETASQRQDKNLEEYIEGIEIKEITKALEMTKNKTAAAEMLGISFRALRYRIKKLGLD